MAAAVDPASMSAFRSRLEARREELAALVAEGRRADAPIAPDKAIGRLTREDALQQQQMSAELVRRHEQELLRVEKALEAIDAGTYGQCQRCGEPIAEARLNAMPHATICVACAGRRSGSS